MRKKSCASRCTPLPASTSASGTRTPASGRRGDGDRRQGGQSEACPRGNRCADFVGWVRPAAPYPTVSRPARLILAESLRILDPRGDHLCLTRYEKFHTSIQPHVLI